MASTSAAALQAAILSFNGYKSPTPASPRTGAPSRSHSRSSSSSNLRVIFPQPSGSSSSSPTPTSTCTTATVTSARRGSPSRQSTTTSVRASIDLSAASTAANLAWQTPVHSPRSTPRPTPSPTPKPISYRGGGGGIWIADINMEKEYEGEILPARGSVRDAKRKLFQQQEQQNSTDVAPIVEKISKPNSEISTTLTTSTAPGATNKISTGGGGRINKPRPTTPEKRSQTNDSHTIPLDSSTSTPSSSLTSSGPVPRKIKSSFTTTTNPQLPLAPQIYAPKPIRAGAHGNPSLTAAKFASQLSPPESRTGSMTSSPVHTGTMDATSGATADIERALRARIGGGGKAITRRGIEIETTTSSGGGSGLLYDVRKTRPAPPRARKRGKGRARARSIEGRQSNSQKPAPQKLRARSTSPPASISSLSKPPLKPKPPVPRGGSEKKIKSNWVATPTITKPNPSEEAAVHSDSDHDTFLDAQEQLPSTTSSKTSGTPRKPIPPPKRRKSLPASTFTKLDIQSTPSTLAPSPSNTLHPQPPPPRKSYTHFPQPSPSPTVISRQLNHQNQQNTTALLASTLATSRTQTPIPPAQPPALITFLTDTANAASSTLLPSGGKKKKAPPPPPPPLRRRRSAPSLTGTSSNGLRSTMRKEKPPPPPTKSSGGVKGRGIFPEDESKRKPSILSSHKHKHSASSHPLFQTDSLVPEKARKRYEGVWAANRALIPIKMKISSAEVASEAVHPLVVRDIWSRSRLSNDYLFEVWELVDRGKKGWLGREEFVVGMWLLDRCLAGRKLPVKVADGVWESVRRRVGLGVGTGMGKGM